VIDFLKGWVWKYCFPSPNAHGKGKAW